MDSLKKILNKHHITLYGIVDYESCLPLLNCRAASKIPDNARSVISFAFPYYIKEKDKRNLCYYACIKDYHIVIPDILNVLCSELEHTYNYRFVPFTDNSPLREVETAVRAGLGVLGRNTLLITEEYGSFVFLSEIVTDMPLGKYCTINKEKKSCINCGECERKCPGNCISKGRIDKTKCLSDITQKKGILSDNEILMIKKGGLAWGCDICQTVCPMNKNIKETDIPAFIESAHHYLIPEEVTERIQCSAYNWRGEKVILRNLKILNDK